MRITDRAVKELCKRAPPERQVVQWDDDLPGFGVRRGASGRASFICKYRIKGDPKQRFVKLGDFPALGADRARFDAGKIRNEAQQGRDLLAARREAAAADAARRKLEASRGVPVSELLDGWRATIEAAIAAKEANRERVNYERELLRVEKNTVRPDIGTAAAGNLDPDRFQALVTLQPTRSLSNGVRAVLARFTKWANAEMVRRGAPVRWPAKFELHGKHRDRHSKYTLEEAARLWIGAGELGRRGALVRLILLTGSRRSEAADAEFRHMRLEDDVLGPHWEQPDRLAKNNEPHRVPLSAPAVALLRWLPRRETRRSGGTDLLFAGRGNARVGNWTDIRSALREAAGLDDGTLHDVRRTIVSVLGDHGFDPQVADKLLNHSAGATLSGVMGVYQRSEFWVQRRAALDKWAELLMAAVEKAQGAPLSAAFGFDAPFADARIRRPRKPLQAALPSPPAPPTARKRVRSQASKSAAK